MRYTLLDKDGVEQSIAIPAESFSKPIVRGADGQPTSYEAMGYTLGFSDDTSRTPYSDASTKASEKGARFIEARNAAVGQTAASVTEAAKPSKATGASNPEANKTPAAAGKAK